MKKKHSVRRTVFFIIAVWLCIAVGVGLFWGAKGYQMYQDAASETTIEEKVDEIRGREEFTSYTDLTDFYIEAVKSVEDRRFEKHPGIDPLAICRALWSNIKARSFEEGGSTITQQLAKNLLFTQDKKIERKFAEIFAAFDIEAKYSKKEILELYVNTAYFGSGYYGIYAASTGYFGKTPSELTEYEAAMLAGVVAAPSAYSPDVSAKLSSERTRQVLYSMVRNKVLTQEEADRIAEPYL
ncbi:MAG: biosynthetic peptidoglycan transglycosylase [Eubacteriales bacterium]|nr:biosynthetic peptidoglycan transglycosylase [Eubacteriales bacterium]